MAGPTPFHRIFGYSWADFFRGTGVSVELEVDLSLKHQFLDLVIIRRTHGEFPRPLPDGFEDLGTHNLVTFKSHQQALDGWTLDELVGHYVNYRKQAGPSIDDLLPASEFKLYAVCVRHPQSLEAEGALRPVRPGVWDVVAPARKPIRVIVVHGLPLEDRNAMLHLFSARPESVRFASEHYRPRSSESSTLLHLLIRAYQEDPTMALKLEEYLRRSLDEILKDTPVEKRLEGLTPEDRIRGLPAEDRIRGLPAEDRIRGLPAEDRVRGLPTEDRVRGLAPEEILRCLPLDKRLAGLTADEVRSILADLERQSKNNGDSSASN